ncbi:MAG: hypothetical protein QN152_00305 [Armatimonadota bacterium]|nr:hypothetical protein [Armatimonadota bacterium]MDR7427398.1 hypothetical protein [Armatimonadota bacterium]MDR7463845.1 hypothetical protein [Armatimonadota bacterium]MDR7470135.1 hypothetical protein [Armatimonadota bacterium]MDR7474985.1 hypothetical protein [Armatimonadota bacterium]
MLREATCRRLAGTLILLAITTLPTLAAPEEPGAAPTPNPVVADGRIVAGERVGGVRLAMPLNQITALLGGNYKVEEFAAEKIVLYEWRSQGFWVSLDAGTRAIRVISVFGPNFAFRTDRGITLLDPWDKAEAAHGKSYRRWEFREEKTVLIRYPAGLQFGVVNDPGQRLIHGRIFQIGVFPPGDLPPARQP